MARPCLGLSRCLGAYLGEVERTASERERSIDFQECLEKWLSWARQHADLLDPLKGGLPFEVDPPEPESV